MVNVYEIVINLAFTFLILSYIDQKINICGVFFEKSDVHCVDMTALYL